MVRLFFKIILSIPVPVALNDDFMLNPANKMVTFAMGSPTNNVECITITGTPDSTIEGKEFIGVTIQNNATYIINGAANGDTTFLEVTITDEDVGRYRFFNT